MKPPTVFVTANRSGRIDPAWVEHHQQRLGGDWYARPDLVDGIAVTALAVEDESAATIVQALDDRLDRTDWLLIIRCGLALPDDFTDRLQHARQSPDCPDLLLPLGDYHPAINPDCGTGDGNPDSLVAACGFNRFLPIDTIVPGCLVVFGGTPPRSAAVLDTIFVHDPDHDTPADAHVAAGHVRLAVQRLHDEAVTDLPAIGRDQRTVTLHISHNWGGGVARWIEDYRSAEQSGHHLVLAAGSDFRNRRYGQWLRLYALGVERGLLREWHLNPVIADTANAHPQYVNILHEIIQRYGIGRILVSSLIGHSLDVLRTGLPTLQVLHDYYPAWPLLEHDPLNFSDNGVVDLHRALQQHGDTLRFARTDAAYWQALTQDWSASVAAHAVTLVAPGQNVTDRWHRLLAGDPPNIGIIPHGFRGWPEGTPDIAPQRRADSRLQLVIVGRMQPGKGLDLLKAALPVLRDHAHITLLGTGHGGRELFGLSGLNLVYQYDQAELPALLQRIAPQAALLLSTVAETWNYTLSELRGLGVVPIATRLGSFAERIRHGVDGWLIDPQPAALIEAVRELQRAPHRLNELRAALPPERSLAAMVGDYVARLPAADTLPAPPQHATTAELQQAALAGQLANFEQRNQHLVREHQSLTADLQDRTRWAQTMERQFRERSAWATQLDQSLHKTRGELDNTREELQASRTRLEATRVKLRSTRSELHITREELSGRIEVLEQERDVVLASRSWRITRPLRVAARVARNIRLKRLWNPLRWPRLLRGIGHRLRAHGWRHTVWLLQSPHAGGGTPPPEAMATPAPAATASDPLLPVRFSETARPRASIVIPVFNQVHLTRACLASLAAESAIRPFEVIVVDDCSSDATADFLARCEGIRVVTNTRNLGFIHSCNAGAGKAKGEYLVFLNNDTTVTPDWLDALIDTFEQHPQTGVAGARLVYPDGRLQEAGGIIFNDASGWNYGRHDVADRPEYNFACPADYVSGACLAIPRRLFRKLAGFDPRYAPAYYEDTDLCFRVREAGFKVMYQPACTVVHHEGATSGTDESSGTKRYQAINRDKFRQRWAKTLAGHPAPVEDPTDTRRILDARHRQYRGQVLIVDATTPQPDHDSGSLRMRALMDILLDAGYRVSFAPQNLAHAGRYTRALQMRGVETLHAPRIQDLGTWLAGHGPFLDHIILSRHYVASFYLPLIRRHATAAKITFDTVDLHFLREQREAELTGSRTQKKQAAESRRQELELVRTCDHTLVVSPVEQALLSELVPDRNIHVVSNIHTVRGRSCGWGERQDLLFVGGFQHVPNVDAALWMAQDILPLILQDLPEVRLHLIGSRMPPEVSRLAAPGIVVHGFVADLEPWLNRCRLSLAPLRYGAGVKGKVNQAMSFGLPVVATTCAAEGMYLEHGRDVLVADTAEAFAAQVVAAYRDESLWLQLSEGGLANVEKYFSTDAARRALLPLLEPA